MLGLAMASQAIAEGIQWPFGLGPTVMTGKALYQSRCGGCHALDHNKYGPSHHGVFGRLAGTQAGYHYSAALAHSGVVWNAQTLDQWLSGPRRMIPGTRMNETVQDAAQRRLIIEFLEQQSGSQAASR